jgi:hypothetical protein
MDILLSLTGLSAQLTDLLRPLWDIKFAAALRRLASASSCCSAKVTCIFRLRHDRGTSSPYFQVHTFLYSK